MKRPWFVLALLLTILCGLSSSPATGAEERSTSCPAYLLKKLDKGFDIEALQLRAGEVKVFQSNPGTGTIAAVLPPALGGSGGVEDLVEGRLIILRCTGEQVELTVRAPGGKEYKPPPRLLADLNRQDVRVSVTGPDGGQASFLISENRQMTRDEIGPSLDPFAGKLTLEPHQYAVFTSTSMHRQPPWVKGEVGLEMRNGYLFARGRVAGGLEGDFAIDLGSTSSSIVKDFLPADAVIEKGSMTAYSACGARKLPYSIGGATGEIKQFLGVTTVTGLNLGTLTFPQTQLSVMAELDLGTKRPVAGIIGMDLLLRGEALEIVHHSDPGSHTALRMGPVASVPNGTAIELPFSLVEGHVYFQGRIGEAIIHFVLDTGSEYSYLETRSATAAGLRPDPTSSRTIRGLDNTGAQVKKVTAGELNLDDSVFRDVEFEAGTLAVFEDIAHGQNPGLIGNSFLQMFRSVQIDFTKGVLRLTRDPRSAASLPSARCPSGWRGTSARSGSSPLSRVPSPGWRCSLQRSASTSSCPRR